VVVFNFTALSLDLAEINSKYFSEKGYFRLRVRITDVVREYSADKET